MNQPDHKKIHVLVIDDDQVNLRLMSEALNILGMRVTTDSNPRNALKKMEKTVFDLVITDINMPEMNGNELLREIRKRDGAKIPMIAATAAPYLASTSFNRTLSKPFRLRELWQTVSQVLPTGALAGHQVCTQETTGWKNRPAERRKDETATAQVET